MKGVCTIKIHEGMIQSWHHSLILLYRPLIGASACLLYETLYACAAAGKCVLMDDLLAFCFLQEGTFTEQRKRLEKYELLISRIKNDDQDELIEMRCTLRSPLTPRSFLRHEVFGRLYFEVVGAEGFERIKRLYDLEEEDFEEFEDISAHLDTEPLEDVWSEEKEQQMQIRLPSEEKLSAYPFNWTIFWGYPGNKRSFPERLRSKDNLIRIARIASIYGLDEKEMRKRTVRAMDDDKTQIDFNQIANALDISEIKGIPTDPDNYNAAPISFLQSRQPNQTRIMPNERKMIRYVADRYGFANEVINTLLEFCMKNCDGALIEKYVLAVANNWSRQHVETRAKALELIHKETSYKYKKGNPQQAQFPDWYYSNDDEQPASEEEIAAVQEYFNRLTKGGAANGTA